MIQIIHIGQKYQKVLKNIVNKSGLSCCYHHVTDHALIKDSISAGSDIILCVENNDASLQTIKKEIRNFLQPSSLMGFLNFFSPKKSSRLMPDKLEVHLPENPEPWQIEQSIGHLLNTISISQDRRQLQENLQLRTQELAELNKIGIALSSERELNTLLELILQKAREITNADAGSLYLIEKNPLFEKDDNNFWKDKQLRFKLAHNDSISASYQEFVMPVERKSMAGYTALAGRPLNIADAYNLPEDSAFQHNRSFDERMGYHTRSVLCIPLHTHQGEMIGVLQLINRKIDPRVRLKNEDEVLSSVIPFDNRCEELALSLASQAAVSIENMRLYDEIKRLFEGFIVASVHAIEQRDPTTYGHSERVATLTVGMAEQINRMDYGPFKSISFNREDIQQIRYAALLHDFGKIGVREKILVKENKLYPEQLEGIRQRSELIKKVLALEAMSEKLQKISRSPHSRDFGAIDEHLDKQTAVIDNMLDFIIKMNEPRPLDEKDLTHLQKIGRRSFIVNDSPKTLLQEKDIEMLSIGRGSLSEQERKEIELHVTHTFNFLSRIPWASHLKDVPEIAYSHHEKLDGSGYPRRLGSAQIPIQARMMAIADIFDALTAWDRPYKKAVSIDRALDILEAEAKAGKLDADLLQIFIGAEIFRLVIHSSPVKKRE